MVKGETISPRAIAIQDLPLELHALGMMDPNSVPVRIVMDDDMVLMISSNNADISAAKLLSERLFRLVDFMGYLNNKDIF